ncbi:MAG: hypothetical protein R3246_16105, partial [Acidimicrobiia bacterium]|nr:hypothetical protein [Acidimicrobiia bacterium]
MRRPWRAALGAVMAIALSFIPAAGAGAAQEELCDAFAPESPCRLDNSVAQVNWFWSSNVKVTSCVPPPELPAEPPTEPPGLCGPVSVTGGVFGNAAGFLNPISPGHIGVSMKAGDPDMRAYVKYDLGAIPPGAELNALILELDVSLPTADHIDRHLELSKIQDGTVSTNSRRPPSTFGDQGAKIMACAVTEPWAGQTLEGGDPPFSVRVDQDQIISGNP